jgi:hypothetical protein
MSRLSAFTPDNTEHILSEWCRSMRAEPSRRSRRQPNSSAAVLRLRRVRTFSAVPFVPVVDPGNALPLPPNPPFPPFEQRIAVTLVFHLLKATPPVPPGVYPPGAPQLQINVVVTKLMPQFRVTYQIQMAETDN